MACTGARAMRPSLRTVISQLPTTRPIPIRTTVLLPPADEMQALRRSGGNSADTLYNSTRPPPLRPHGHRLQEPPLLCGSRPH